MRRALIPVTCICAVLGGLTGCESSIHDEAAAGRLEQVTLMLAHHPELVDARNRKEKTPLFFAVSEDRRDLAALLIARGADLDAADETGLRPLHAAVWRERWALAGMLLDKGADIEAADVFGNTPLHTAAMLGKRGMVDLLLERGADPFAENGEGMSPAEVARAHRQEVAAEQLEAAMKEGLSPADLTPPPQTDSPEASPR